MNQLDRRQIEVHVPIVGWIYIISSGLFLLIGGFVFALLTGIGIASGDRDAVAVLGIVGTFVGGLMVVLALPGLAAGLGLLARKPWARVLALVVAVLNLLNFPLGTVIGVYAGWVLLQDSANDYFAPQPSATAATP